MILPTFLIAGACAAGCSQLSAALKQHPDVYLPRKHRPEPHYFYYSSRYRHPLQWYSESVFSAVNGERAIGETSGSYLNGERVPERIKKALPDIRIIIQLRSPIERTYAGYRASALHGFESLDFESAIDQEASRRKTQSGHWAEVDAHNYTGRSMYGEHLQRYAEHFSASQLLILKSEDTRRDPQAAFARCFKFLGVDPSFRPDLPPSYSSRSVVHLPLQAELRRHFGDRFDLAIDAIERERLEDLELLVRTPADRELLDALRNNLRERIEPMPYSARHRLDELFASDRERLTKHVPFSVEEWFAGV